MSSNINKHSKNDLNADIEAESFSAEFADIKPLEQDKVAVNHAALKNQQSQVNAIYRQKVAESFSAKNKNFLTDGEVPPVTPEDCLCFKMSGVQPNVFKKLKQGKYTYDYHLDLHRKTVAEARSEVYQLIKNSIDRGYRCLLITHGKGAQSNPPARIKSYVNHWLQQVENVIAFHSAIPKHGGTGSVYVLLKKTVNNDRS